jgi:hypothetical protein
VDSLKDRATAFAAVPISKLSPENLRNLVSQAKPNDDPPQIPRVFVHVAASDLTQAAKHLDAIKKTGLDVKSARKSVGVVDRLTN